MYCSVFIMLLEVRFAAIHNSNIRWVSLKIKLYEVGSIPYTRGLQPCSWGPTILKGLATTLIKHTWSGQSSSSRLLENCRQVCWSRLEINFPGEWVPRSRVQDLCPTPNPNLNLPDSVTKCKSNIKTYSLMQPWYFIFLMQIWAVLLNCSLTGFVPELFFT